MCLCVCMQPKMLFSQDEIKTDSSVEGYRGDVSQRNGKAKMMFTELNTPAIKIMLYHIRQGP